MMEGAGEKRWPGCVGLFLSAIVAVICLPFLSEAQLPSDPTFSRTSELSTFSRNNDPSTFGRTNDPSILRTRGRHRDPWRSGSLSPVAGTVLAVKDPIDKTCPTNWIQNAENCYKFVRSPKKDRSDAKIQCQVSCTNQININQCVLRNNFILDKKM